MKGQIFYLNYLISIWKKIFCTEFSLNKKKTFDLQFLNLSNFFPLLIIGRFVISSLQRSLKDTHKRPINKSKSGARVLIATLCVML